MTNTTQPQANRHPLDPSIPTRGYLRPRLFRRRALLKSDGRSALLRRAGIALTATGFLLLLGFLSLSLRGAPLEEAFRQQAADYDVFIVQGM